MQNLLSSSLFSKETNTYRTVISPVVLYECKSWSLTLREEHRLRTFENRVLNRTFGSKRDVETGEWGRLHDERFRGLYSSPDIIRVIKQQV